MPIKKSLSILFAFCLMLIAFSSITFASSYPAHINGDANYILCDGHMGTAWYVDRSSLSVQKYAPPEYIIAVNVVHVNDADRGNTTISGVRTYRFLYNYDTRRMYVDLGYDDWRYLSPNGTWAETGVSMPAGEIAFAIAYRMKFYGLYDSSFYNRI